MRKLLSRILLGSALAVVPVACESGNETEQTHQTDAGSQNDIRQVVLETIVKQSTSNNQGVAQFPNVDPITIVDTNGNPISNKTINGYSSPSGDVYLSQGGIAVFPSAERREGMLEAYLETDREIIIHPSEGVTLFDRDSQDVVYDLLRWVAGNSYTCNGIFSTEQLIEGREDTVRLISYFDPTGKVKFVYDTISYLIDFGLVDDLPAGKNWFVLTPDNPLSPPMMVQRGLAQGLFNEQTYDELNSVCVDRTSTEGQHCDDGLFCTKDDKIVDGVCQGMPRTCGDGLDWTYDYCDEERRLCVHENID